MLSLADKQLKPFAATPANEMMPAFSPDGRWIAYESDEAGAMDVYVRPYPGPGGKWPISAGGGAQPHWTKGGRELVYLAGPAMNRFMAVEIAVEGDALRPGKPQLLFEMPVAHPTDANMVRRLRRREPLRGAGGGRRCASRTSRWSSVSSTKCGACWRADSRAAGAVSVARRLPLSQESAIVISPELTYQSMSGTGR